MSMIKERRKFKREKEQSDPTKIGNKSDIKNKEFNIENETIKEEKSKR